MVEGVKVIRRFKKGNKCVEFTYKHCHEIVTGRDFDSFTLEDFERLNKESIDLAKKFRKVKRENKERLAKMTKEERESYIEAGLALMERMQDEFNTSLVLRGQMTPEEAEFNPFRRD